MKRTVLAAIVAAGLLAGFGCSGGGQVAPSAPQPQQPRPKTAQARFTIDVPIASASSSKKRPAYVSAATQSITFSGAGIATQTLSLAPLPNANCPAVGGFYQCSLNFAAPVGNSTLTVQTFASTDGSGTPLSRNTVPIAIVQDQTNSIPVTLNGVVSTLVLTLSPTAVTAGTAQAITATLGGKDAAGDTIIGPGAFVDATGAALTPTLQSSDNTDFTVGSQSGNSWPVAYNGAAVAAPTITLIAGSLTNATQQITVNPAPTSSPGGTNVITNGDFATGTLSGWYTCFAAHVGLSAPVNPSPAPNANATPQGSGGNTVAGTPRPNTGNGGSQIGDASVQTTTPTGDTGGFAHFALTGHSDYPFNGKGLVGICQDIPSVPAGATLSFSVYEGGNDAFATASTEAYLFPGGSFSSATDGAQATAAPPTPLFAEQHCWNNLYLASLQTPLPSPTPPPVASGGSTRSNNCGPTSSAWTGGVWRPRTFDVSSDAGSSATLMLGSWRSAASGSPSTTTYYNYQYFANVQMIGTGSATPPPLSVAPNPFSATQTGAATLTASETAYGGSLTVSSDNTAVITVTSPATASGGTATINVNVVNAGFANITVTDSHGQSVVIPVTVTLTPVTIN